MIIRILYAVLVISAVALVAVAVAVVLRVRECWKRPPEAARQEESAGEGGPESFS